MQITKIVHTGSADEFDVQFVASDGTQRQVTVGKKDLATPGGFVKAVQQNCKDIKRTEIEAAWHIHLSDSHRREQTITRTRRAPLRFR